MLNKHIMETFFNQYGGDNNDYGRDVSQTGDGIHNCKYILFNRGDSDVLLKTDHMVMKNGGASMEAVRMNIHSR